jgi:rhodanese-related sulfurtransferase
MAFVKELIGGFLIIVVAGIIGIAQNTVRDDSIALVPKASHAVAKGAQTELVDTNEVKRTNTDNAISGEAQGDWPTDAELAAGELGTDRLRSLMDTGNITIVDARSEAEFEAGRIAGSVNIPYDDLIDHYERLKTTIPLDAVIVCYCESVTCDQSKNLAKELEFMGYENVLVYKGGWQEWDAAGYPTERTSE